MTITLLRHAEVIKEYQGKYNGHIDIPLSSNGKQQAKATAIELQSEIYDEIYCSDLLRAKQTLDAFSLSVPIVYTAKLREKSWGIHEGKSFEEIEKSGVQYRDFSQWIEDLDGEDIDTYITNAHTYFLEILSQSKAKNILIVTHSGFIKSLLVLIQDISLEKAFSTSLNYSSYMKLTFTHNKFSIF